MGRYVVAVSKRRDENQRIVNMQSQRIHETIEKNGWAVQGVLATMDQVDPEPTWAYTVGMTDAGLPELMIIGNMRPDTLQTILNNAVMQHLKKEIVAGQVLEGVAENPLDGGADIRMQVRAASIDYHVQQALNYYGDPYNREGRVRVLQIVWPDAKGAYPGSFIYDERMVQPLI